MCQTLLLSLYLSAKEEAGGSAASEGGLDGLDLHGDGRENCLLQSVELIEAAPGSALNNADEDPPHALHINALWLM